MSIKFNEVTWYSKLGAIILFILVIPILMFYMGEKYQEVADMRASGKSTSIGQEKQVRDHISSDPRNGTYEIDGQQVTLVDGVSVEQIAGSVATVETRIFGKPVTIDLDGDGSSDQVFFISQETGGTGIFFYVTVAIQKNNGYKTLPAVFLGDRIAPQTIEPLDLDHRVAVNYAIRKDDEPMAVRPSLGVTKYFTVQDGKLVEAISKAESSTDPFMASPSTSVNTSNIVGYFAGGAFYWYVPDWVEQKWRIDREGEGYVIVPKSLGDRKFSNIVLRVSTSTETNNALYLYDTDRKSSYGRLVMNEVLLNKHTEGSITIQMDTNTQIYHVQKEQNGLILDHYYIDGSGGKTLNVTFSAPTGEFPQYEKAIRGLVEGIGKGAGPQG